MPATKISKFESKIARERREAERTAAYRDGANDARACPWIYPGYEEVPKLRPARDVAGSVDLAGALERSLRRRDEAVHRAWQLDDRRGGRCV